MDRPWSDRLRISNFPELGLYDLQLEPSLVPVEPAERYGVGIREHQLRKLMVSRRPRLT
jgi:hypothetical protein